MEAATSGKYIDKTGGGIRQPVLTATYRFNKTIATATIRFIGAVAISIYKGLIPIVYRMLTYPPKEHEPKKELPHHGTTLLNVKDRIVEFYSALDSSAATVCSAAFTSSAAGVSCSLAEAAVAAELFFERRVRVFFTLFSFAMFSL